jgi:hypothetical protein
MPTIAARYRVSSRRDDIGIAGSSLGALVAFFDTRRRFGLRPRSRQRHRAVAAVPADGGALAHHACVRRIMGSRVIAIIIVGAMAVIGLEPMTASSPVSVKVRPRVSFPGGVVRTLVRTPRDTENRGLRIAIEAGSYFASSDVQLDGADAPELHDFEWTSLPDGDYRVEATLMRAGAREVHAVECFVVVKLDGAARDDRGRRTPSAQTTKGCS